MASSTGCSGQKIWTSAAAIISTLTWLGLTADTATAQTRKISDEQAKEIALQAISGEAMDVAVERKLGKQTLVVEVIAAADGSETDVIIDMETGEVLGTEK